MTFPQFFRVNYLVLLLAAIACTFLIVPGAHAQALTIDSCAPHLESWQLTGKVVYCIQNAIISAVVAFMGLLTAALQPLVAVMFVLTLILYGFRLATGEQRVQFVTAGFVLRVTIVLFLSFNLTAMAVLPFAMVEELLALVTGGTSPWVQIDTAMGQIFGFGDGIALFQGLLGLIGAALFSAVTGLFLFLFGLIMLFMILSIIFRCVYTYLVALVLLGFLMIISPMIIPMALFGRLDRYVKKWFDLFVAIIIQPMLLFAFLWFFLSLMDVYIGGIFAVLGGNDFSAAWRENKPFFSWITVNDPNMFLNMEAQIPAAQREAAAPLVQGFLNPLMGGGMDMNVLNHPGIHFGADNLIIMQGLIAQFISVAIVCYLLKSVIEHIPHLADDIAGVYTGTKVENLKFMDTMKQAVSQLGAGG